MRAVRPFRFGAGAFIAGSGAEWGENSRRIEEIGYDTLLMPDHFGAQFAPVPALMAATLATNSLRVGTTVHANDYHHPVVLAKETASIDVLSDGRLELGIGAGDNKAEYDQVGITFDPPGVRVDRMQEAIHVIKGLWDDEPFSYAGHHYTITDMQGWPKPVQRLRPPIMIGGGAKRMLSFAAQEADIVGILAPVLPEGGLDTGSDSEERLAEQVDWVREAAGNRFAKIELAMLIWNIRLTDDVQAGAEDIARKHAQPTTTEQVMRSPYYLIGTVGNIVERLQELRERFCVSYFSVFPNDVETFAPVVARFKGR